VLLGGLILGERITKAEILCLCIAFLGVYILFSQQNFTKDSSTSIALIPFVMLLTIPIMVAF
jgi:drug/metabolite transporter (DMT)-like permease